MAAAAFQFPVYQIDFTAAAAGKRVASTKRRIRWRFGFPNRQALEAGRSGTDCRGEEHEIVVVWSITSGKRQVMMDGREIHYSTSRTGVIDHSWSGKGNHILKLMCHAAPPMTANPGFRQYDLFIDGQSFFTMPKVYELGVSGSGERMPGRNDYESYGAPSRSPTGLPTPRTPSEEEEDLKRAIDASLQESQKHLSRPPATAPSGTPVANGAAPDLFSSPAPGSLLDNQSVMSYTSAPVVGGGFAQAPPVAGAPPPPQPYYTQQPATSAPAPGALMLMPATHPPAPYGGVATSPGPPVPPAAPYASPPHISTQPSFGGTPQQYPTDATLLPPASAPSPAGNAYFAPTMHASDDPFAPKPPTRNDIANEILKGYSAPPTPAAQTNGVGPQPVDPASPPQPAANLSMNGGLMIANEPEEENLSELEKAMRKLVNVEHIDEPAEEKVKLTMKQAEETQKDRARNKSKPMPPAAHRMVGSGATLSQISQVKATSTSPKEGIMNTPPWDPNAAAAGMLVVHGLQNSSGPPPLQPRGMGVVHGQPGAYSYGQAVQPQQHHHHQQPMYAAPPPQHAYAQAAPGYPAPQYR